MSQPREGDVLESRPSTAESRASRGGPDRTKSGIHGPVNFCSALKNMVLRNYAAFRQEVEDRADGRGGGLWQEVNALRDGEAGQSKKKERKKFSDNIFGRTASHRYFEGTTMVVILLNALQIGYDADYSATNWKPDNLYDGPAQFIVAEVFFAVYFTAELVIRFLAYRRYSLCLTDSWFIFDSALVIIMNLETFILPFASSGGSFSQLNVLRLLRLLRVSRMVKLMKTFPELMLIVKGLAAAVRAVSWTLVLLLMVLFVSAIIFTNQYHQGLKSDDDVAGQVQEFFGNMGKSMFSLVIMGTLLDDVTNCSNAIRLSRQPGMLVVLIGFIVLSSFMMLNMLLGILVEVVANTAEGEKMKDKNTSIRASIVHTLDQLGQATNGITRSQFLSLSEDQKTLKNLESLGIQERHLQMFASLLYESQDEANPDAIALRTEEIVGMLFELQPSEVMEASELATVEKVLVDSRKDMKRRIRRLEALLGQLNYKVPMRHSEPSEAGSWPTDRRLLQKGDTKETDLTTNSGNGFGIESGPKKLVSLELLDRLNRTDTVALVDAVRRRMGCEDLEATGGVPLDWFDADMVEDMNKRLCSIAADAASQ
eukprot:TRINITY_DN7240_c0_g1_i1.p1 TRINITY_DN7240_c0_g1~~TRINITY_DN7240_c0_g1_i1.p1  ORF type:complete len:596 (+),score=123.46 TRINITY_DN7240_c0_g1_i1:121-1908(+)